MFSELEFSALIKKFELEKSDSEEKSETVERVVSNESKDELIKLLKDTNTAVIIDNGIIYAYNGATASHCSYDRECAEYLAENANELISYDIKSIYEASDKLGVRFRTIKDDVMLSAYVLDSQGGHDLERLVSKYLSGTINADESKAAYVYRIAAVITAKISDTPEEKLYREIELPLAAVLADMEEAGFLIDREGIAAYGEKLKEEADYLAERIYFLAGEEFNINSPKQLGDILFEKLKLPSGKKTKTGYSTNAEILQKLAPKHPIVSDILDYRQLTKLIGTYVTGLLKLATEDGRIHTNFKQTGTATGRLSSAEPNLQNIPVRTEAGRELRKYFLPRKGYKLISADYSQIELRLLACISGDENMLNAFASGEDIHTSR